MIDRDASTILKLFGKLEGNRYTFERQWRETANHTTGRRRFREIRTPGVERMAPIYDPTPMMAGQRLAMGIAAMLINFQTKWHSLTIRNKALATVGAVPEFLESISEFNRATMQAPSARLIPNWHEAVYDLVFFGTGGLESNWDTEENGLIYTQHPLDEFFLGEDSNGRIDMVFRRYRVTARNVVQRWGEDASEKATKAVKDGDPFIEIDVLHYVRPNDEVVPGKLGPKGMDWASTYIVMAGSHGGKVVEHGGFFDNPYHIARWDKENNECYGRGPGWTASIVGKSLNEMNRTTLEAAQYAVDPALAVESDSVPNPEKVIPGAMVSVNPTISGRPAIEPIPVTGDVRLGIDMIERQRALARSAFHNEILAIHDDPRMTATQVVELANQSKQMMSPIIQRITVEILDGLIARSFNLNLRNGAIKQAMATGAVLPVPPELANQDFVVEYNSPILRAQKSEEMRDIAGLMEIFANLGQAMPGLSDNLETDEAARRLIATSSAPSSLIRPRDQVAEIREMQAQQAAEQQQREDLAMAAEAVGKAGPTLQAAQQGQGG